MNQNQNNTDAPNEMNPNPPRDYDLSIDADINLSTNGLPMPDNMELGEAEFTKLKAITKNITQANRELFRQDIAKYRLHVAKALDVLRASYGDVNDFAKQSHTTDEAIKRAMDKSMSENPYADDLKSYPTETASTEDLDQRFKEAGDALIVKIRRPVVIERCFDVKKVEEDKA